MVVDSASKFNIIDQNSWTKLKDEKVKVISMEKNNDQSFKFKAYGGHSLDGTFEAELVIGRVSQVAKFYVVSQI